MNIKEISSITSDLDLTCTIPIIISGDRWFDFMAVGHQPGLVKVILKHDKNLEEIHSETVSDNYKTSHLVAMSNPDRVYLHIDLGNSKKNIDLTSKLREPLFLEETTEINRFYKTIQP